MVGLLCGSVSRSRRHGSSISCCWTYSGSCNVVAVVSSRRSSKWW